MLLHVEDFANGLGLRIHIRTKGKYEFSYIEAAAIQIGEDVLEVRSFGSYLFNSISEATLPSFIGSTDFALHHEIKNSKQTVFSIVLNEARNETIEVSVFKDMVSVAVHNADAKNFGASEGLLGGFDNLTLFVALYIK